MENSSSGGSSAIVQFRDKGNMGIKENKTLLGRDWNIISLPFRGTTKLVKKKKKKEKRSRYITHFTLEQKSETPEASTLFKAKTTG